MIEKQEVLKIIKLSKLKVEDEKIDKLQNDFSQILDYVSELQELNTENIPEMSHSIDIKNVEREDNSFKFEEVDLIPKEKDGYLVVKKILKDE